MIHVCSAFRYLIPTNIIKFLPKYFCSKHDLKSIRNENVTHNKINIDKDTITLLERLSLVKCDSAEGVKVLEDSIAFADQILHINVDNVKPLYTVLENEVLNLRPDKVTQGNCRKDILKNAKHIEEDYFVAPPGNIPLSELEED